MCRNLFALILAYSCIHMCIDIYIYTNTHIDMVNSQICPEGLGSSQCARQKVLKKTSTKKRPFTFRVSLCVMTLATRCTTPASCRSHWPQCFARARTFRSRTLAGGLRGSQSWQVVARCGGAVDGSDPGLRSERGF